MSEAYESRRILDEYLLFHYGADQEVLTPGRVWPEGMRQALGFAARTPARFPGEAVERGLDLGCAVGRSTFEMARRCREVIGVDFSRSFVDAAERLRQGKGIPYGRVEEGSVVSHLTARAPADVDRGRVRFLQGDAAALPSDIGTFDRVHAANLLCRMPDPALLLARLPALVRDDGHLLLTTPCTWLESFTPPEKWPQGRTLDWLEAALGSDFRLETTCEEPFLIRETARKFQWSSALLTLWRRINRA